MKITLDQYVINQIHNWPTLYHDKTFFQAKMKVLDQFLNVIGNGIRCDEELLEQMDYVKTDISMDDIKSFVSGESVFYGYTKTKTITDEKTGRVFHFPESVGRIGEAVTEAQKSNYPEVVYWMESTCHEHKPYPNFKEEYSTIYQCPAYLELDESFIAGAIEFYQYCLEWFETKEAHYSYAFPCATEKETQRRTEELQGFLKYYDSNDEISEAYGTEFNGDIYQFQVDRWQKEKNRIFEFITATIAMLEEKIRK